MRKVKLTILGLIALTLGLFLHYNLPQHDVVRVVGTYQERQDLTDWTRFFWSSPDDQSGTLTSRDVQFIQTVRPDGKPMVYRNEDTGWGWPPYFKFDTASLQTESDDLKSTREAPKWAVVTHYGWRNELISIFPNAVGIRAVDSPDVKIIPWFNLFFFVAVAALAFLIWRMLAQLRERMIDPAMDRMNNALDDLDARADAAGDKARGFWARLFGRGKR